MRLPLDQLAGKKLFERIKLPSPNTQRNLSSYLQVKSITRLNACRVFWGIVSDFVNGDWIPWAHPRLLR